MDGYMATLYHDMCAIENSGQHTHQPSQIRVFTVVSINNLKLRKKTKIRNRYNLVPHLIQDTICESDKTQETIQYRKVKRSDHSQQVTTRLQDTDKDAMAKTNAQKTNKISR